MLVHPNLTIATSLTGRHALIVPAGEIDMDSVPDLDRILDACLAHRPVAIHVDMHAVAFCDCRGLNAFVRAHRLARGIGATLWLYDTTPIVTRLLFLTGTDVLLATALAA
ncbi:STAS domain-containing protein [Embleya sp. NBC_00896]|uniref:STAS domain-containing protein n=1 Tax=Embleya sp. NBC_00896 TaxID=2975961 RepID=UPI002F9198A1|nr:STAS domain-containing protein [Embleya sp. NBC_00896]